MTEIPPSMLLKLNRFMMVCCLVFVVIVRMHAPALRGCHNFSSN